MQILVLGYSPCVQQRITLTCGDDTRGFSGRFYLPPQAKAVLLELSDYLGIKNNEHL
jgi:hypothetical protein